MENTVDRVYILVVRLSVYSGWEKLYVVLTADSLLFYKDQKHAKAVSVCHDSFLMSDILAAVQI